jgi:hypothetical protein
MGPDDVQTHKPENFNGLSHWARTNASMVNHIGLCNNSFRINYQFLNLICKKTQKKLREFWSLTEVY